MFSFPFINLTHTTSILAAEEIYPVEMVRMIDTDSCISVQRQYPVLTTKFRGHRIFAFAAGQL